MKKQRGEAALKAARLKAKPLPSNQLRRAGCGAYLMQWMPAWLRCCLLSATLCSGAGTQQAGAQFTLLHTFTGGDGANPVGAPIVSGSVLYGMTDYGYGDVLFQIDSDGTGFTILHVFPTDNGFAFTDGTSPAGSLTLSGSLYGMTAGGGINDLGTVFRIDSGGTNYAILHNFAGTLGGDGANPVGSLVVSGSAIYGMTISGGSSGLGTIFKIDSGGYSILHNFAGGSADGAAPEGSLTLSGSTLYGVTFNGGSNWGVVFKINTDGSGYAILHDFVSGDPGNPVGTLALSGSTLFGMASGIPGTVFKINTNGTGYTILHNFASGSGDGRYPLGSLTLSSSTLYGMTQDGGSSDLGVLFQVNSDGTGYAILHNFAGGSSDGANPNDCSLALSGSALFGMTRNGGSSGYGTVFTLSLPIPSQSLNISTRVNVQPGDNALIGGFIITGNDPKKVLIRAIGPSLLSAGVSNALADPILELHQPDGTVVTNDNWRQTQEQEIIDTTIPPADDHESAIVATLDPGPYTAIVRGANNTTGTGLVEVYDLDSTSNGSQLANLSTRGLVQTGDGVMIGGFILGGGNTTIALRGIGPSLTALGVAGALQDPKVDLHNGDGDVIASNDNWIDGPDKDAITAANLDPANGTESALLATLAPGAYTAVLSGVNSTTGVALVEIYNLR